MRRIHRLMAFGMQVTLDEVKNNVMQRLGMYLALAAAVVTVSASAKADERAGAKQIPLAKVPWKRADGLGANSGFQEPLMLDQAALPWASGVARPASGTAEAPLQHGGYSTMDATHSGGLSVHSPLAGLTLDACTVPWARSGRVSLKKDSLEFATLITYQLAADAWVPPADMAYYKEKTVTLSGSLLPKAPSVLLKELQKKDEALSTSILDILRDIMHGDNAQPQSLLNLQNKFYVSNLPCEELYPLAVSIMYVLNGDAEHTIRPLLQRIVHKLPTMGPTEIEATREWVISVNFYYSYIIDHKKLDYYTIELLNEAQSHLLEVHSKEWIRACYMRNEAIYMQGPSDPAKAYIAAKLFEDFAHSKDYAVLSEMECAESQWAVGIALYMAGKYKQSTIYLGHSVFGFSDHMHTKDAAYYLTKASIQIKDIDLAKKAFDKWCSSGADRSDILGIMSSLKEVEEDDKPFLVK